ncbi:hypothetical protein ACEUZ9_002879 [Paracoccus litorisediminis]|uniref:hypothetical protein n=1 Tax=Paracoccus litorisediminis TaxID=2006130 RepID=UPI00372DE7D1
MRKPIELDDIELARMVRDTLVLLEARAECGTFDEVLERVEEHVHSDLGGRLYDVSMSQLKRGDFRADEELMALDAEAFRTFASNVLTEAYSRRKAGYAQIAELGSDSCAGLEEIISDWHTRYQPENFEP